MNGGDNKSLVGGEGASAERPFVSEVRWPYATARI